MKTQISFYMEHYIVKPKMTEHKIHIEDIVFPIFQDMNN